MDDYVEVKLRGPLYRRIERMIIKSEDKAFLKRIRKDLRKDFHDGWGPMPDRVAMTIDNIFRHPAFDEFLEKYYNDPHGLFTELRKPELHPPCTQADANQHKH